MKMLNIFVELDSYCDSAPLNASNFLSRFYMLDKLEKEYILGFEYVNSSVEAYYHDEGRFKINDVQGEYNVRHEYTLKYHLGNGSVYCRNAIGAQDECYLEILQENHYYPFGSPLHSISKDYDPYDETVNPVYLNPTPIHLYQYNSKELQNNLNSTLYDYGVRWYDALLGRWNGVDPLADDAMQIDKSPYQYAWNNPVYYTDPDGRCPWCVGVIVGAAFDYGTQVVVNYASGNENPWTNVDPKSIAVSAVAGAIGVGSVAKAGNIFFGRTLKAAEMAIDGAVNSLHQYVNKGEVDLKETAIAVGLGQAVRSPVRDKVKAKVEPKLQQLEKQASTAQRYARNAEAKGSRPGKVKRLQNEADAATKKASNARTKTNMKAAATGASVSSGAGRLINNVQYQKEENER